MPDPFVASGMEGLPVGYREHAWLRRLVRAWLCEAVADAALRLNIAWPARALDLGPKPADEHLQVVWRVSVFRAPDSIQERLVRHEPPGISDQMVEQFEFDRGQLDRLATNRDA